MKPIVMFVTLRKKMLWLSLSFEKSKQIRRQMCRSLAVITGSNPAELHGCLSIVSVEVLFGRGHLGESYRMS